MQGGSLLPEHGVPSGGGSTGGGRLGGNARAGKHSALPRTHGEYLPCFRAKPLLRWWCCDGQRHARRQGWLRVGLVVLVLGWVALMTVRSQ